MRRVDDLLVNGLKFVQDDALFPYGTDGVEIANFAAPACGTTVCDLGAGTGIISVLLAGKYGCKVTAVEIQSECCEVLRENARINGLDIKVVNMRIQEYKGRFNAVICNPPYSKTGSGEPRGALSERIACFEQEVTFAEVCECAARLLSTGGKFWLIHHANRLAEVMATLKKHRLEPKKLQILRPSGSKPPHLFMLECIKDGKEGITVLPEREVNCGV